MPFFSIFLSFAIFLLNLYFNFFGSLGLPFPFPYMDALNIKPIKHGYSCFVSNIMHSCCMLGNQVQRAPSHFGRLGSISTSGRIGIELSKFIGNEQLVPFKTILYTMGAVVIVPSRLLRPSLFFLQ